MTAYIVIPTYNEAENIEALVAGIMAQQPEFDLVIVDDNSPDGTSAMVEAMQATQPRLHLIKRAGKLGFASAEIAGIRYALAQRPDFVLHMDADFSHHPDYLPTMVAKAESEGADVVVGSRYCPGGGTKNWGLGRIILSRGANLTARTLLGLRVDDCTSGFRCYRRAVLESFDFDQITVDGYSFLIEMTYLCQRRGYRFAQVPIIFEDRALGTSKISKRIIFEALGLVLRRAVRRLTGGAD
ncbi:MAG: polyprenol monophosphomannose synthase [Armatimonadetes bacterium]|nr:polyprenol monophosphomannose synthase [Armatimonadota bacterium]